MSLTEQGKLALSMRALADANSQPINLPVERYLSAMESSHELLPGSAKIITDKILGRVGDHPPRIGGTAVERLTRAVEYLEGAGKHLINPEYKADDAPPLRQHLRRLGVPAELAGKIYNEKAAEFAGRTPAALVQGVFSVLAQIEGGKHLGYQPRVMTKPEGYTPPRHPDAPTVTESHYRRIRSSF
jgi:hypothetical protein